MTIWLINTATGCNSSFHPSIREHQRSERGSFLWWSEFFPQNTLLWESLVSTSLISFSFWRSVFGSRTYENYSDFKTHSKRFFLSFSVWQFSEVYFVYFVQKSCWITCEWSKFFLVFEFFLLVLSFCQALSVSLSLSLLSTVLYMQTGGNKMTNVTSNVGFEFFTSFCDVSIMLFCILLSYVHSVVGWFCVLEGKVTLHSRSILNKPGPAQVGAISKAQCSKRTPKFQSIGELGNLFRLIFFEKSLTMPKKTEREDPLGFFNIHSVAKLQNNERGTLSLGLFFKVAQCQKNLKGGPFGLVRYCLLQGKPFRLSSLGQQVHFGVFWKLCRTFGRAILVSSGWSLKKRRKTMTIVGSFLEKRRLKNQPQRPNVCDNSDASSSNTSTLRYTSR